MRSFSLFTASTLLLLGVTGCPVKETCADGFMASGDDCVPVVIADMGPRDAGDAGPRDAGDAAVMDEGIDEGVDEGTPDAGPCGMPCTGTTLVCDEARGMCAECTATNDDACTGATPVCDTTSGSATESSCVACNADSDCTSLAAAQCDTATHACVPCTGNAACVGRTDTEVCGAGTCVQCTSADRTACGTSVCNGATRVCAAELAASADVCQTCVADAQCQIGQLCIPMTFGAASTAVGSYCLWRQDAAAGPAGDCTVTSNRPYVNGQSLPSIDGTTTVVCALRSTTCTAIGEYSTATCTAPAMPNLATDPSNLGCGVPTLQDAWCRPFGGGSRCTLPCLSDDDCPGSTCAAGAPRVCSL